jgi:hypothetical protein
VKSVLYLNSEVREQYVSQLLERDGNGCFYCGLPLMSPKSAAFKKAKHNSSDYPNFPTLDHFEPKSRAGENGIDNYVLACLPCNRAKADGMSFVLDHIRKLKAEMTEAKSIAEGLHRAAADSRIEVFHLQERIQQQLDVIVDQRAKLYLYETPRIGA